MKTIKIRIFSVITVLSALFLWNSTVPCSAQTFVPASANGSNQGPIKPASAALIPNTVVHLIFTGDTVSTPPLSVTGNWWGYFNEYQFQVNDNNGHAWTGGTTIKEHFSNVWPANTNFNNGIGPGQWPLPSSGKFEDTNGSVTGSQGYYNANLTTVILKFDQDYNCLYGTNSSLASTLSPSWALSETFSSVTRTQM